MSEAQNDKDIVKDEDIVESNSEKSQIITKNKVVNKLHPTKGKENKLKPTFKIVKKPNSTGRENDINISTDSRKRKIEEIENDNDNTLLQSKRPLISGFEVTKSVYQFSFEILKEKLNEFSKTIHKIEHPNFSEENSWKMKDFQEKID